MKEHAYLNSTSYNIEDLSSISSSSFNSPAQRKSCQQKVVCKTCNKPWHEKYSQSPNTSKLGRRALFSNHSFKKDAVGSSFESTDFGFMETSLGVPSPFLKHNSSNGRYTSQDSGVYSHFEDSNDFSDSEKTPKKDTSLIPNVLNTIVKTLDPFSVWN